MKIFFFINALEHGGAARVLVTLSNELSARGYFVYIMANTLFQKVNYKISSDVNLVPRITENHLKLPKVIRKLVIFNDIRKKAKTIKPDIIIGFMPRNYFLIKILSLGLSIPVIASERNHYYNNKNIYEYFIRYFGYPFADAVTFLAKQDIIHLGKKLPKKVVMYNPIEFTISDKKTAREKNILAAGRLDGWHHKGFDNLISVWSRIAKKHPEWTLEIAGDGSEKSLTFLKGLISQYGIERHVNFLGFRTDMDKVFQTSSVFVLSSRYEGLGQVLLEAMSQGCACIAFEFDGRTREFITSSDVGIVVEDQNMDELEKAIVRLIDDEALRESLGERAKQEAFRFSKDAIVDQWEALFNKVTAKKK